jgi:hypothetical protein
MSYLLSDGEICPLCGKSLEGYCLKKLRDRDWVNVSRMSMEECKFELEKLGIDIDWGLIIILTLVEHYRAINQIKKLWEVGKIGILLLSKLAYKSLKCREEGAAIAELEKSVFSDKFLKIEKNRRLKNVILSRRKCGNN